MPEDAEKLELNVILALFIDNNTISNPNVGIDADAHDGIEIMSLSGITYGSDPVTVNVIDPIPSAGRGIRNPDSPVLMTVPTPPCALLDPNHNDAL